MSERDTLAALLREANAAATIEAVMESDHEDVYAFLADRLIAAGVRLVPATRIRDIDLVMHGTTSPGYEFAPADTGLREAARAVIKRTDGLTVHFTGGQPYLVVKPDWLNDLRAALDAEAGR